MSFLYYPLGSPVIAASSGNNWSFEQGLSTWTPDSTCWQVAYVSGGTAGSIAPYHGDAFATFDAFVTRTSTGVMTNDDTFVAAVGQSWTATCRVKPIPGSRGQAWGRVGIKYLDAANAVLQTSPGSQVIAPYSASTVEALSTVTATAPASTAKVKLYVEAFNGDTSYYTGRICFDWCTLQKN